MSEYPAINGALIRARRKRANMSMAELGKEIGKSEAQISRIERGDSRTYVETLREIADVFGMKTTDFINN